MSFITAQQAKLDLELIPKEKRSEIRKYNRRLNPRKIQIEPKFQVILDALALTPCYSAFLITADVPEGQDFDALSNDEEIVSFLRELGHTGEINSLNDVVVDRMHQPWKTFAALINKSLSRKTTSLDKLRLSRAQILWVPVSVIFDSSLVLSTVIPQLLPSFTPAPQQSSPIPAPTTEATNPQSALPNFASIFQFNNRVTTLEKEVAELKKDDPLKTQVTVLIDEHLDVRLGATRYEFMKFLLASIVSVQLEEPEFEVADSDMPHDQEETPDNDDEPKEKVAYKCDITKNIRMEYPPKRRWSTLEKKRANIMIKAIDKQLKERRMMRSLEKFVGGRDYETDLRLLQQKI
uniref:Uncharacterized protein n=1 Tax=Tanacetum cinerariifolium TaxID=118510 RepID=A0A6L2P6S0_TANCI|nr:hypothetical protein [Tanacetum cinerariifolium]